MISSKEKKSIQGNDQAAVDGDALLGAVAGGAGAFETLRAGQVDKVQFGRQRLQFGAVASAAAVSAAAAVAAVAFAAVAVLRSKQIQTNQDQSVGSKLGHRLLEDNLNVVDLIWT